MPAGNSGNGGGGPTGPVNGDILNAISGDVTLIRGDTSVIKDNTRFLANMDHNITAILQGVGRWSQQDARSRIYDTSNRGRTGQQGPYNRNNQNQNQNRNRNQSSSRSSSGSIRTEDFIDTIFEELEKSILGAGFKGAMQQNMKEFAAAMGLQLQDLPSAFGKVVADQIKRTDLAKNLTTRINGAMDRVFDDSIRRMRAGINEYYVRRNVNSDDPNSVTDGHEQIQKWNQVLDRMTENFRNRRTNINNDPTPGGADDGNGGGNPPTPPNPNPPDPEVPKILEDKLQYLYPIYNSINSINQGVKVIADSVGTDMGALSDYGDLFKQNNEENDNFITEMLKTQGGSGSGDLLTDLLGDAGVQDALNGLTSTLGAGSLDVGAGLAGLTAAAAPLVAGFVALNAALWIADKVLDAFTNCFKPLQEGFDEFKKALGTTTNRFFISEKKKIEDRTARITADVEVLVKKPFEILEEAANDWYNAWDNNLKVINATQGYTKADLQNLMSSYAERLRSEGLADTVSAADISNNLAKVLESGLSGRAAEEFSYLATVLGNAIPTQDFFSYASTYASIAANQIAAGKSQADAIDAANEQLTRFANSLLYSSRELSGGFSTGLTDASELLANAVKIATTAGLGDSSYIASTLTAVSSIVGAIAPDLASGITDAIVDAALGGNNDSLTALRSLADTGASNTAFLNAFARDPKGVLSTLFTNLGNMQRINADNFMEVAESLAETFGLSIGALTRVDFLSLAESVQNISLSMNSLDQNMKLLQEGQTTTTAEQLKMNQINEMILNEGLSYVLDNQAARSIQEHMWQQEIAAELQETTYGIELEGKSLEFLCSISETVHNILNFLNPFSWLGKLMTVVDTIEESNALKADIRKVLEAGKVGQGNAQSLHNLTTYDVDKLINQPGNLAEMMGQRSSFRGAYAHNRGIYRFNSDIFGILNALTGDEWRYLSRYGNLGSSSSASSPVASQYSWATKGLYNAISSRSFAPSNSPTGITQLSANYASTQAQISNQALDTMQSFLGTMQSYVEDNRSFDEWVNTAQGYGIVKLEDSLAEFNLTMSDLEDSYQKYQAAKVTEYDYNRDQEEKALWDRLKEFMDEDLTQFFNDVRTKMDIQIELLTNIDTSLTNFFTSWQTDWLQNAWRTEWIQTAWRAEWLQSAWQEQWLNQAWRTEWLQTAWNSDWLQTAWQQNWLQNAWQKNWIETAWNDSWLTQAWGEQWLNQAWRDEWIEKAWRQDWIANAWNNGFLLMWRTEWLEKAWKQSWLDQAWGKQWLDKAWQKNWLDKAWSEQWIDQSWKQDWLESAWKQEWLTKAWETRWLQEEWADKWLTEAWKQNWVEEAWKTDWLKKKWNDEWVNDVFKKQFVKETVVALWGNRWFEFFNIFRDRFGGLKTTEGSGLKNDGKTEVDLESGLYQIYTKETGKAAMNALKDVEEKDETGDAILALTKQLTKNAVDLRDPQVQTNVLLSQILIVLEAIMQAENTSGGASLATTLASLGIGLTQPNIANTAGTGVNATPL